MMTVNEAIAKAEQWRKEGACGPAGLVAIALLDELENARALLSKAIPEGYVVVPKADAQNATRYRMIRSRSEFWQQHGRADFLLGMFEEELDAKLDSAMIAAAPSVEGEGA